MTTATATLVKFLETLLSLSRIKLWTISNSTLKSYQRVVMFMAL